MSNTFDDLIPKQEAPVPEQTNGANNSFNDLIPKENKPSPTSGAFMTAIEGFNRSFGRMAEGTLDLVSNLLPNQSAEGSFKNRVGNLNKRQESRFARDKEVHPVAGAVGEMTGYLAQGLAIPTSTGGALSRITSNMLAGGSVGALQYGSMDERINNAVAGAAVGGIASGAVEKVRSVVNSKESGLLSRVFTPKRAALNDLSQQIKNEGGLEAINKGTAVAKELGENISPAEAIGGRVLTSSEKRIKVQDQAEKFAIANVLKVRDSRMENKVSKLINDFVPEGDDVAKSTQKKLYDKVAGLTLDDNKASMLIKNPVIADEINTLNSAVKVSEDIRNLPNNSVLKLDKIKQQIDKQLYRNSPIFTDPSRSLLPDEASALKEARNSIVHTIDEVHPEYAQARKISERIILKKNMMEDLSKIKNTPGNGDEIPLDKIYNKLWGTPEKQSNFLESVDRVGGDSKTAKNVLSFLNQIRNSPLESLVNKTGGAEQVSASIYTWAQNLLNGSYNKELVKLSIDGDLWQKKVGAVLSAKNPLMQMARFKDLITKVKKTQVGSYLYNKFKNTDSPEAVAEPSNMDIQKMTMEPKPRMNPDSYMKDLLRQASKEQENSNKYNIKLDEDQSSGLIDKALKK